MEFALPDGSYTNVNEGYFGTANHTSCVPRTLCDKDGGAISMLVNNKTPWRRDGSGMPKGKGTLSGVIVHDLQPRYGYTNEGYIGRYSVRVLEKEEIDLAASESSSNRQTLVEWNWNNAEVRTNADGTIAPDRGNGSLWCTDPAAKYLLDNEYNGLTTSAGLNGKNALKFENTYWWDFAENTGYAVALKFSTEGAGANLSLNFLLAERLPAATSIYGPVYWQVEYSTDGVNFTVLLVGAARPWFVLLAGSRRQRPLLLRRPGLRRPRHSSCGRPRPPEVTLLIKARSTQCIASNTATVDQGDTGTFTSDMAANKRSPMRFGTAAKSAGRGASSPPQKLKIQTTMKRDKSHCTEGCCSRCWAGWRSRPAKNNGEETRVSEFGPYKKEIIAPWKAARGSIPVLANQPYDIELINPDNGWLTLDTEGRGTHFTGDDYFKFQATTNDGFPRMEGIRLWTHNRADTIYIKQEGFITPKLDFSTRSIMVLGDGGQATAQLSTNLELEDLRQSIVYTSADEGGWISDLDISNGFLILQTDPNADPEALRNARITLSYRDGWNRTISSTVYLTQANAKNEFGYEISFSEVRDLVGIVNKDVP